MEFIILFIFGLAIGSFLLVLIERLPKGKPVLVSRSVCDFCGHVLSPLDLVPVFSFVFLKGKCRYCHKRLSYRYPLMELFLGISFVLLYVVSLSGLIVYPLFLGSFIYLFLFLVVIYSTLVVIFFTDLFDGIIPLYVVLIGVFITIMYLFLADPSVLLSNLLTAFVTGLFFLVIFFITKMRGIGLGDVIYGFYMGLILGYPGIIVGLYVAFLTGAVVSIILIMAKKKRIRGDSVPFGPFLIFGTIIALFLGQTIWNYVSIYIGM